MIVVETNNPDHGAAYRVLYECTRPFECSTRERRAEIQKEVDAVVYWASGQDQRSHYAYQWAAQKIMTDIDKQMAHNDLGKRVTESFATLPKPPEKL
jgi:hypothetical protein